jgi:hypothetical protein
MEMLVGKDIELREKYVHKRYLNIFAFLLYFFLKVNQSAFFSFSFVFLSNNCIY